MPAGSFFSYARPQITSANVFLVAGRVGQGIAQGVVPDGLSQQVLLAEIAGRYDRSTHEWRRPPRLFSTVPEEKHVAGTRSIMTSIPHSVNLPRNEAGPGCGCQKALGCEIRTKVARTRLDPEAAPDP